MQQGEIVLASGSPRRRELLQRAGVKFRVHAVDVDESLGEELARRPLEAVSALAERKAKAAVDELLASGARDVMAVIGSDTMVVCCGEIFGKPHDRQDAERMLGALSGRVHDVHTAVSVWRLDGHANENRGITHRTFVETTHVHFRDLSEGEIEAYIQSGDPFDKAGAYGIQSGAGCFVDHIEGDLDTVIGLPVERLKREFPDLFA